MEAGKRNNQGVLKGDLNASQLVVTYFTDPLCCWSWGIEPHLDALKAGYGDRINIRYVMGGMIPSWEQFRDDANAVSRPGQMGPVWMHAAQLIGRPIDHLLWMKDPPSSSYPAGVAVKCAHLQSPELGVAYFKCVQRSAMLNSKNVAKQQVLEDIAAELAAEDPSFNPGQFIADYQEGNGIIGFREDLALVARYRVTRFPTLILEVENEKGIVISGYRTSEQIMAAIDQAFPGFQ